jgi:hypothetical protein
LVKHDSFYSLILLHVCRSIFALPSEEYRA